MDRNKQTKIALKSLLEIMRVFFFLQRRPEQIS